MDEHDGGRNLPSTSELFLWGVNCDLGLGDDAVSRFITDPTKLNVLNTTWVQVACGMWHTAAVSSNGEVFTWGWGGHGRLGHGDNMNRSVPTKVEIPGGEVILKVSCGPYHTAAVTGSGKLFTWGGGDHHGKFGYGPFQDYHSPRQVEALRNEVVVDVICGDDCTIIFTASGLIYMCGSDLFQEQEILTPTIHQHYNDKRVTSVGVKYTHSFAAYEAYLTASGEVYTWGEGRYGTPLGHGNTSDQSTPKLVEALSGIVCKQVDLGGYHAAVLTEGGKVYTFGNGYFGQLGHGINEDTTVPTLVRALETVDITQIQCGRSFTMALSTSGYLYTWGKLCRRDGKTMVPCLVEGLREHNVVQMSCDYKHCAVLVDSSPSAIRQAQQSRFNNKEHYDVTFIVGENPEPIYANIDVLTKKSEYFEAMFRSDMRESIERVVVVPNTSRAAYLTMLEYVCLDGFVVDDVEDEELRGELLELADMYLLEGLRLLLMREDDEYSDMSRDDSDSE